MDGQGKRDRARALSADPTWELVGLGVDLSHSRAETAVGPALRGCACELRLLGGLPQDPPQPRPAAPGHPLVSILYVALTTELDTRVPIVCLSLSGGDNTSRPASTCLVGMDVIPAAALKREARLSGASNFLTATSGKETKGQALPVVLRNLSADWLQKRSSK